jgi:signal transduction histidine kinase
MLDRIEGLLSAVRSVSDNIAHDLRTPLARLRNTLERTRDELNSLAPVPVELIALVEQSLAEADRMMSMFAGLLRIARVESGALGQRFAPIEIEATLHDLVELYEPLVQERQQQLSLDLEPALVVDGDRDLVFQTLANVLDNACKYAPKGSTIDILAKRNTLEASGYGTAVPDGGVSISIRDRGPGIRAEARERAFQRLSRLSDDGDAPPGHGLGLSLAQAVMRAHRGDIVLSDANPGLMVELRFPALRR